MQYEKPILGCDLCNTIADINTRLFAITGMRDIANYPLPLPHGFFATNSDIFWAAKPFRGAPEILRHLVNQGAEIHYITARPEWAREITTKWLSRHGFPGGEIHMAQPKKDVIKRYNIELMIEDHPGEILAIKDLCHVLVRAQPYNVGHPNRFTHWGQVVNLIHRNRGK
ncbi:MAG: hypothetical protein AB1815_06435 [Bacillota bacterium]